MSSGTCVSNLEESICITCQLFCTHCFAYPLKILFAPFHLNLLTLLASIVRIYRICLDEA